MVGALDGIRFVGWNISKLDSITVGVLVGASVGFCLGVLLV